MSNSNESSGIRRRQYTFNKRSSSLFKKAGELGVLCDADVAIIIFSHTGKLSHFSTSTSSVKEILTRFKDCVESLKVPAVQNEPDEPKEEEEEVPKEDVTNPEDEQLQILGKHLTGMSSQELQVLEQHLNEALLCIKERKEQILMQHLAQSRTQEEQVMLENETLRRQVQELQGVPPCTSGPASIYIQHPISETPCSHVNDEEPDTTLQLGPPTWLHKKSKAPEGDA